MRAQYLLQSSFFQSVLDPNYRKKIRDQAVARKALQKIGVKDLDLTEHEQSIAGEVIDPKDIREGFSDVGGLDNIIDDLRQSIIWPLTHTEAYRTSAGLLGPPKGVLLYGPPGCGKTLLAKALAKESGATFINIKASTIQSKWYGDSTRLVSALFTLAKKLQPSIIFIDEIDSFLRERTSVDHEASNSVKAEFMSSWDGLLSSNELRIMVLGATNRPNDIDAAILRRMPKRFSIGRPNEASRRQILTLMLCDVVLDSSVNIGSLARETAGLSGSDLKEFCREAAFRPVQDAIRRKEAGGDHSGELEGYNVRPIRQSDFSIDTDTHVASGVKMDILD